MAKLHEAGNESGGGMAYVLVYWLAQAMAVALFLGVAIVAANKAGWLKFLG